MSADLERRLLARAEELDDTGDLGSAVTRILGGARVAGLDPDAFGGLTGAALALGEKSAAVYRAGAPGTRADRYPDDRAFVGAVLDADDDIAGHAAEAARLRADVAAALDDAQDDLAAARRELAAARALGTHRPCDGCHERKAAAIAAAEAHISEAQERISLAEAALEILGPLLARLRHALRRIRDVPDDLAETYELVYRFRRRGGVLPHDAAEFITGEGGSGTCA